MREVGRNIDYSYEHVRKVVAGELTFTRAFNDALCHELGLNAEEMWNLAQTERLRKKYAGAELRIATRDDRVQAIWAALDADGREDWIRMGRALVRAGKAVRA
jgi:hypothetical protein